MRDGCPKCGGLDLLVVEQACRPLEDEEDESAQVVPVQAVFVETKSGLGEVAHELGSFELWVCEACGYTEWFAREIEALDPHVDREGTGITRYGAPETYRE